MKMLKNKAVLTLTGGDIFSTIGISIFNIVLLMYAKEFTNAKLMVTIVSIASILPGVLSVIIGRVSDMTHSKSKYLVLTKFIQATMYIILANIIDNQTEAVFYVVILINIFSDMIGSYNSGLRLSIMKQKIPSSYRQQVIGLNQSVGALLQPVGQAIGVAILGATHNYALAGYINALTFMLAALILMLGYRNIHTVVPPLKVQHQKGFVLKNIQAIIGKTSGMRIVPFLAVILLMNAIGASMDTVLNLFLLTNEHLTSLSFGVEILLATIAFLVGIVLGGVTNVKLLDQMPFRLMAFFQNLFMILLFLNFMWLRNYWIMLMLFFVSAFLSSKVNAKINALIIEMTEPDMLATVDGTLSSMAMIAVPVGTITVGLLYNAFSPLVTYVFCISVLVISLLCLISAKQKIQ
ncbi:MFS transporter [Apilactobacillus sp. TMW 2.2459]|uniref:MFS transporter n=1 Tax=Apilactobacillus xinyiensis TaxID=2841032 RepID=UPI00200DB4B5|nr:MFS transporter [Apilactobacillus xinyiensis]MCL0312213.1 MFS transporter [Apilactobacillus xinyiensis]